MWYTDIRLKTAIPLMRYTNTQARTHTNTHINPSPTAGVGAGGLGLAALQPLIMGWRRG